jgi:hypothetical protein
VTSHGLTGLAWTVVLRRQPLRIVQGRAEGGYTNVFEIICCGCGDDPGQDHREVSPQLKRIRGPYPIAAGVTAYQKHVGRYHGQQREVAARAKEPGGQPPAAVPLRAAN